MSSLSGKIAIVTGGTRGIGKAIAIELYNLGAEVIITGTKENFVCLHQFKYYCVDFASNESTSNFISKIALLKVDILINNAGVNELGSITSIELESFERIQKVNVTAPFLLCKSVLPNMIKTRWGRIVNISSIWGIKSKAFRASYSASKFAIDGLTAAISAEVASKGILINSVSPGFIDTELTRKVLKSHEISELVNTVPAKRLGTPKEVAIFVTWLAGIDNTYITGQNIAIDGGFERV